VNGASGCINLCFFDSLTMWLVCADHVAAAGHWLQQNFGLNGASGCINLYFLESLRMWLVCADHVAWGLALQVYERATGREPRVFQRPGEARS